MSKNLSSNALSKPPFEFLSSVKHKMRYQRKCLETGIRRIKMKLIAKYTFAGKNLHIYRQNLHRYRQTDRQMYTIGKTVEIRMQLYKAMLIRKEKDMLKYKQCVEFYMFCCCCCFWSILTFIHFPYIKTHLLRFTWKAFKSCVFRTT